MDLLTGLTRRLATKYARSVVGVLRQWVTLQTRRRTGLYVFLTACGVQRIEQIKFNGRSTRRLATEEISLTDGDTSLTVSPEATNMQLQ